MKQTWETVENNFVAVKQELEELNELLPKSVKIHQKVAALNKTWKKRRISLSEMDKFITPVKSVEVKSALLNDQGLNDSLKWWLIDQFPNKCKYENSEPQDRIFDIYRWMKNGMPYQEGVAIFKKYFKHKNLIEMFENRETESLKTKLRYKLKQSVSEL